jgi:hypothetical protein
VYFNGTLVIQLSKEIEMSMPMNINSGVDKYSPQKLFQLTSVNISDVQLDIERLIIPSYLNTSQLSRQLRGYHSYQTEKTSICLRIANGNLKVKASDKFSAEMEQITKKKLPSETMIQMILNKFDNEMSEGSVFKDLLPYPEQGKIYIGFTTHQTTGCCSNLAARVIPNVCIFLPKKIFLSLFF